MESIEDIEAVRRFEALEQKRQERIVRENRIKEKVGVYNSEKMIGIQRLILALLGRRIYCERNSKSV